MTERVSLTHVFFTVYFLNNFPSVAQTLNSLPAMQETQILILGWEDPLE